MKFQTRVTAKKIAEQLSLSIATVDRVLNNRGNVKEETYRKVMDKAKELGYTPNKLASFLSKKKEYAIAVVFPEYPQYFWGQIEIGINKAFDELCDYGLRIETFRFLKENQIEAAKLIKEIIDSKKFEAIALSAGEDAFVDVIDYGIDHAIPIFTFNHDSPESKRLCYIGSDYRSAGRLSAELLCKFIGTSGKAAIILSSDIDYQAKEKVAGFREVLIEYPNVEMIGPLKITAGKNIQESLDNLRDNLYSVQGVYVANAELGNVARYLEQLDLKGKISLVGHDMTDEIYHYLQCGVITATISQDPISQGYLAVKELFNHLAYEEVGNNKEIITKLEIITRENAKFYI